MPEWKDTVNLPRTGFPMKANLQTAEPEAIARWEAMDLYAQIQERRKDAPAFVLHDGPPYANGQIHLGTALNKILKDLVIRSKSMAGFGVPFVPGYDCHGLPIELRVDRELGSKKREMSRADIRRACRAYAERFIGVMTDEFKRLGVMGEWHHPYLTMDYRYQADIVRALGRFVEQGLVYKGKKPVHWCIHCRTALAEAEVEYADHTSPSIYVEFPLAPESAAHARRAGAGPGGKAGVGPHLDHHAVDDPVEPRRSPFTRARLRGLRRRGPRRDRGRGPGAARVGAAVGRALESPVARMKGEALEGISFQHPLYDRLPKGVLGDYVTLEQGTGAVHTAPGHGADDFLTGVKYGLEIYAPVGPGGHFLDDVGPVRRAARLRRQPQGRGGAARAGAAMAPRRLRAPVPALLALPQPGDLPGHVPVVRADGWRTGDRRRGRAEADAAAGRPARDRSPGALDPVLGPRPHLQHGDEPAGLVHLAPARLGRADSRRGLRGVPRGGADAGDGADGR